MTKEDEENLLKWLQDKDISEVMDLLMRHGNRYSRRILKFFRWFCKYVPITIMLFHAYGMWNFSQHPRDMFIPYAENTPCYLYILKSATYRVSWEFTCKTTKILLLYIFLGHNRNVVNTKFPYPIKRLEVIRRFNQKSMAFNQSLS